MIQQGDQLDPVCCRTIHSPPEDLAFYLPLAGSPNHNHSGNQRDKKNNVLQTTTQTLFP